MHPFVIPLHRAIAADQQANVCWSPYSVAHALHLLATEAGGLTRDELVAALLGDKAADLDALAAVLIAATLWADPSLAIAKARDAPFLSAPDQARTLINDDVAATTRGLITNLLDTPPAGFHTPAGEKQVPTMRLVSDDLGYAVTEDWQVVNLPAFATDADLGDLGPALDSVPHQSVLTVAEEGIEGAAATAAILWLSGTAVQHVATGVLYFLARITDPVT
ncbi:hypothetical protein [Amycolatopsis magusensis]|uniref:hypothetical protein n=1 Tax=Amycolatopsis magusensis TaxID=882444 RepID=UPI0037A41A2C